MTQCRFCNAPVDAIAAIAAADKFAEVNQAISDASYVRVMAGTEMTFFFLRFVPFLAGLGGLGFLLLMFALPGLTLRWWLKFGKLRSTDAEFLEARRKTVLFGAGGSILFFVLWIVTAVLPVLLRIR